MTKQKNKKLDIKDSNMKVLIQLSGSQCAICKKKLYDIQENNSVSNLGEMAHICGEKPESARYDANMSDSERQSYNNLIYLCPTCHTKIDRDVNTYTVEELHRIKKEHIKNAINNLEDSINKVTCSELDIILKCIIKPNEGQLKEEDYRIVTPQEKINRNSLSVSIAKCIAMGLANSNMIRNYINQLTNINITFEQNLRNAFINKYLELKQENISGDEIFTRIWDFAKSNQDNNVAIAAALSVVAYFFLECDIFEK
ncbi:MAG: hypothetical protein LUG16_04070 [Candidatus Gastranaerophilales bacterium]|nr:hypothetical protein [Candidatus Gastranaerophilales bacterium]